MRTVLGAGYGYKILRTDNWKVSNEISLAYLKSDANEMIQEIVYGQHISLMII